MALAVPLSRLASHIGGGIVVVPLILVLDFYSDYENEDDNEEEKSIAKLGDFLLQSDLEILNVGWRRLVTLLF